MQQLELGFAPTLPELFEHIQLTLFVQECLVREPTIAVFERALETVALARQRRTADGLLHLGPIQRSVDAWSARVKAIAAERETAGTADG